MNRQLNHVTINDMRRLSALRGMTVSKIATLFGVSPEIVRKVVTVRTWKVKP